MPFLYYHAFTNIGIGVLWALAGSLICWFITPYSIQKVRQLVMIVILTSGLTTLITAVDAGWYAFAVDDHIEKENLTSVTFFFVNIVLSALFIRISLLFKKHITTNNCTEFVAAK